MRAAARIKTDRNIVRDEARKAQVIGNAVADADARGLPREDWRNLGTLVETSIAYELEESVTPSDWLILAAPLERSLGTVTARSVPGRPVIWRASQAS